jgi:uncharacterized protein YkwD
MKNIILALLFAVVPAALAPAAFAGDAANDITPENVLRLMNEYRAADGLGALRFDERILTAANDRMRHMEEEAYWAHESPDGVTPFTWLRVRAYEFQMAGENLASGFETARLLVQSWMESPGHRANIMEPEYQDCGIAIIDGSTQGPAVGKSIVVLFGKRKDAPMVAAR